MSVELVVSRINNFLMSARTNPLFVLIAGGSCSGKTTLTKEITGYFPDSSTVSMDDYFLDIDDPNLPIENGRITFDKQESYHLQELSEHLMSLNQRCSIMSPTYNLEHNKRALEKKMIGEADIVIVDGLYAINLGNNLDINKLSIFVDAPYQTRLLRRIARDKNIVSEEVIEHFFRYRIEPLYQKYVLPQSSQADLIIQSK